MDAISHTGQLSGGVRPRYRDWQGYVFLPGDSRHSVTQILPDIRQASTGQHHQHEVPDR